MAGAVSLEELASQVAPGTQPPLSIWQNVPSSAPPTVTSASPAPVQTAPAPVVPESARATPQVVDKAPPATGLQFTLRPTAKIDDLDAGLVAATNRMYADMPEELRNKVVISSGRRSSEEQAGAYQRYISGKGGLAAPPGRSRHEVGAALDFNGTPRDALQWMTQNGPKYGVEFPFGAKGDPAHMQMAEPAARAAEITELRKSDSAVVSPDELEKLVRGVPIAGTADSSVSKESDSPSLAEALGTGLSHEAQAEMVFGEQSASLLAGIAKGFAHVPLGVAQAVLPRSAMEPLEEKIRGLEQSVQSVTGEHEGFDVTGRVIGSTAAILLGARALGPAMAMAGATGLMPRLLTTAWQAIGPVGRTMTTTGAASGGTAFYPEGPENEPRLGVSQFVPGGARTLDTALGTVFGAFAGTVVKGVEYAARQLAGQRYASTFLSVIQKTAGDLTKNTEAPLADAISHYRNVSQRATEKYALRNVQGAQFEGFPTGVGAAELGTPTGLKQAIDDALESSREHGVEVRRSVETVANRVRSLLGLDKEEGRLAEWQAAQRTYQDAEAKWTAAASQHPLRGAFDQNPQLLQALEASGSIPVRPVAPAPFEPRPVTPEAYAQARTAINDAWRRQGKNVAAKTQLQMMQRSIDSAAASAAADYGMPAEEFLRKAITANRYFEENVAPLQKFFGGLKPAEVEGRPGVPFSGVTPAKFYDSAVKIVESGDVRAARDLAQALGPRGRDNLTQMMAARALEKVQDGAVRPAYQYVQEHGEVLREIIGRDAYTELTGYAKIGDEIAEQFKRSGSKEKAWSPVFDWSHSFGPALVAYKLFEGHFKQAALTALALPAYHFARNVINVTHEIPIVRPLVRSAARMKPGSEELDNLIRSIERRVRTATAAASRAPQP